MRQASFYFWIARVPLAFGLVQQRRLASILDHRDMAFTVPIEPRFPNLRKFLIMSENANKYLMRQQNPFLGTVETVGQLKVSGLERFQVLSTRV
eukprot:SAG31_NODE_435_length_15733_cov_6.508251_15_plen_94_part_00